MRSELNRGDFQVLRRVYDKLRFIGRRVPVSHFSELYRRDPDPWALDSNAYEHEKYHRTLAELCRPRYASAVEIGCSVGVLTSLLGGRCDKVLGLDVLPGPLIDAAERCRAQPHVSFAQMVVPEQWPRGPFDLFVFSEVLYYLSPADMDRLASKIVVSMAPRSEICIVHHWSNRTNLMLPFLSKTNHRHDRLIKALKPHAAVVRAFRTRDYRLDLLQAGA